ncbi:MAG: hypothetical protein WC489_01570 [Patescibacteria group bacterium]
MKGHLLAQTVNIGGTQIQGPLQGINTLADVVNTMLPLIFSIAGVLLFLILVWGGADYMTSRGTPEKVKSAQAKLTTALIGFFLLILSYFAAKLISYIFNTGQGIL